MALGVCAAGGAVCRKRKHVTPVARDRSAGVPADGPYKRSQSNSRLEENAEGLGNVRCCCGYTQSPAAGDGGATLKRRLCFWNRQHP